MVRLVKAENLPARDGTTSDPFAVFTFKKAKKQQSWIIYKTLDPSWNQKFEWYDVSRCTLTRAKNTQRVAVPAMPEASKCVALSRLLYVCTRTL